MCMRMNTRNINLLTVVIFSIICMHSIPPKEQQDTNIVLSIQLNTLCGKGHGRFIADGLSNNPIQRLTC